MRNNKLKKIKKIKDFKIKWKWSLYLYQQIDYKILFENVQLFFYNSHKSSIKT